MPDKRFVEAYDSVRLDPEADARIRAALARELASGEEKSKMKKPMRSLRLALIAAIIAVLLAGAAYASGLAAFTATRYMHGEGEYISLADLNKVIEQVGYPITVPAAFANGLRFEKMNVGGEAVYDENNNVLKEYYGVMISYTGDGGKEITLNLSPVLNIPGTHEKRTPSETRDVDGVTVALNFDHYKFVPEDYEKTAADLANEKTGHYFVSFGADTMQESEYAFADFVLDGTEYVLMDDHASADSGNELLQMAGEIIAAHKA